jgi:acyl carrier protein
MPELLIAMDIQNLQIAQQIVVSYLNDTEQKNEAFDFYKYKKLGDFAIDSLELFEMIMKVEEVLGLAIDDSVIDSDLTIEELTIKLISPD